MKKRILTICMIVGVLFLSAAFNIINADYKNTRQNAVLVSGGTIIWDK